MVKSVPTGEQPLPLSTEIVPVYVPGCVPPGITMVIGLAGNAALVTVQNVLAEELHSM